MAGARSHADLFLQEFARAQAQDTKKRDTETAKRVLARLLPPQRDLVLDPRRRKAALCPRQSGKSYGNLLYALYVALRKPDARVLVLAKVRRQVRAVYWTLLKRIAADLGLKPNYRNMELECELHNGSVIYFSGADTTEEIEKYRGQQYDLVIIDECKSFSASLLRELINEVLRPTLLVRRGTLVLIGTPGAVLNGPFYAITATDGDKVVGDLSAVPDRERAYWTSLSWEEQKRTGKKQGFTWSVHSWHSKDNTAAPQVWEDALKEKELAGIPDDDPVWQREYLGRWVPDDDALVYHYSHLSGEQAKRVHWVKDPNTAWGLPAGHKWRFVLGMDIGYTDDTAFVVAAWSPTHEALHFVHAEKHDKMVVEDIAERVRELQERFGQFDARVADTGGLGKTIVESLGRTYGIHFEAARKRDKNDHIKLLNSDLSRGRIRIDPYDPSTACLIEEWRTAQWAGDDRKFVDPACDDHASDAALYTWRYCYHHWAKREEKGPEPGSPEWWRQKDKADQERFAVEAQRNKAWWHKFRDKVDKTPGRVRWILGDSKQSLL